MIECRMAENSLDEDLVGPNEVRQDVKFTFLPRLWGLFRQISNPRCGVQALGTQNLTKNATKSENLSNFRWFLCN